MRKYFAVLMILVLMIFRAGAEQKDINLPLSIGLWGGLGMNMHSPSFSFTGIPGPVTPVTFDVNKTSLGLNIGALINIPIDRIFTFSGRLGYNAMGGLLEKTVGNTTSSFDARLGYLELTPLIQFHNLLPIKEIYFLGGLELGIVPLTASYKYSDPTYSDSSWKSIDNASLRAALVLGAGYIFKLSDKWNLMPELSFRLPFTRVSSNANLDKWTVPQLRLSVSIAYNLSGDAEKKNTDDAYNNLKVGFKEVRYYNNEGNFFPLQSVKVEDVQYTELFPLIPYVFCPENESKPSETEQIMIGKSERGEFAISKLEADAMKINQSTVDIIGARMKENPKIELTITGTIDGKKEKGNSKLSIERAENIKQYLVDNYGINPELINVRGVGLPSKPSASSVADGIAENRRIEFSSSSKDLFKPIIIENENQRIADPSLIEFVPYVISEDSIASWQMEISQSDKLLRKNQGSGIPPAMQWGIHPNELTNKQVPIDYRLTARTASGLEKSANGTIPIEYISTSRKKSEELPDRVISKFSLILFDFDKSEVSAADMEIVEKSIMPMIKFNSTVKIFGYTDRIGDEKYNQNLAKKRAEAVRDVITSKMKDVKCEVYGVGENVPIFNNDSPVGRQLSRTVQVHIVTPK